MNDVAVRLYLHCFLQVLVGTLLIGLLATMSRSSPIEITSDSTPIEIASDSSADESSPVKVVKSPAYR